MILPEEIDQEIEVTGEIELLTPSGYKPVRTMYKTIPMKVWELVTDTHTLKGSGGHQVATSGGLKTLRTLIVGDLVQTDTGYESVISCQALPKSEAMYDFTIDSPDHLFFSNGIVSHNSTAFAGRSLIVSHVVPKYSSLYVAPYPDQVQTYAKKMLEMESAFRFNLGKQNVYSKSYKNGSALRMMSVLTSVEKTRGGTFDDLLIDEAQGFDRDLIEPLKMVQTASEMPSTMYSGTSLTMDTLLEAQWIQSSQGTWFVKSPDGTHWIDCGDKNLLKRMCEGERGPICPYSRQPLDVRKGEYVHHNEAALRARNIGLHIPQMIIPDIVYNLTRWRRIYVAAQTVSDKKLCQEYFGLPVEEGSREITEKDLVRLCVMQETVPELRARVQSGYYKFVASGCDWGGSDYNQATAVKLSYTVHCIVGVTADGVVDILHFRRYDGMMYRDVIHDILEDHKEWGATMIASDFGVGAAYNMLIRESLPVDSHFIFAFTGPDTAPVAVPKSAHFRNQFSVNRTELLSQIFMDINNTNDLKIRCRSWEAFSTYLTDFLNIYRQPTENSTGNKRFKYIASGSKPNDSLMAFGFVYTLVRLWKGEPLVTDPDTQASLRDLLHGPGSRMGTAGAAQGDWGYDGSLYETVSYI